MGGSSSSSSSSSSNQNTENYDQRATVGGDGIAVSGSGDIQWTDYGVIEGARDIIGDTLKGAADVVNSVTDTFNDALKDNNAILAEKVESDSKEIGALAIQALMLLVAAVVALGIFMGKK